MTDCAISMVDTSILEALQKSELNVEGEFIWGSNATYFLQASWLGEIFQVVYKPIRGERPLWDFPQHTLAKREVAAYLVSEELGWHLVPPTVMRNHAPFGRGMIQLYVEHDPNYHYFTFSESDRQRLKPVVVFDLIVNNADRKGSHILIDYHGKIWCIDHGICFHEQDKLRTVLWDFAGQPIPQDLLQDIQRFWDALQTSTEIANQLHQYLSEGELQALIRRTEKLLVNPIFPYPSQERRSYPWPLI
ncbi:MAG: SCO1664 family protein [Anaerolineales bacterium]